MRLPLAGQIISGRFRVESILGQGGMGFILAAHHLVLDERVALKFLLPDLAKDPDVVRRFFQEARSCAKLRSEHVARVMDSGTDEHGTPFLVLEYLEGHDLSEVLASKGRVTATIATDWVLEACEAIAEAHAVGIVHRDLKPANLFLATRRDLSECIKVLDFGIAKILNPNMQGFAMTSTKGILGTPLYMSPEQVQASRGIDHRTDIWSLGVILYELVAGRPPFVADALSALVGLIMTSKAPPLDAIAGLPDGFEQILQRAMSKTPEQRFPDVSSLAQALGPFATPEGRTSLQRIERIQKASLFPPPVKSALPEPPPILPAATTEQPVLSERRLTRPGRFGPVVAGALAAGVVLGFAAMVLHNNRAKTSAPANFQGAESVLPPASESNTPITSAPVAAVPSATAPDPSASASSRKLAGATPRVPTEPPFHPSPSASQVKPSSTTSSAASPLDTTGFGNRK